MSDDIERLKNVLEAINLLNDGLLEHRDAMMDIVAAVVPVNFETNPEAHGELLDIFKEIEGAFGALVGSTYEAFVPLASLAFKVRA